MKVKILLFLCIMILILSSCGAKEADNIATPDFPVDPDKILVGADGYEKEILPESEEYNKIVALINERVNKSEKFGKMLLDAHDPDSEKHLSYELRESEVFVEFIYNESNPQNIGILKSGEEKPEEINVNRIFFSLTRTYHDCFFIGKDAEYKDAITIGPLADNTELITYVRDLVTP